MNDDRYTKINAPDLGDSNYGEDLKKQFNVINNNFARLSTDDFMKGESGDSIEFIKITFDDIKAHILYNNSKLDTASKNNSIEWLLINNIKLQLLNDTGLNNIDNNTNIIISDIYIVCEKDILNQQILNKSDDDIFNLIKDIYISPIYIFNANINDDAQNNTSNTYKDYTCVYMYSIKHYTKDDKKTKPVFDINSSSHFMSSSAYFDKHKNCICWKINGYETGIPIQGPAGADGKSGKIFIGTYETIDKNGYTDSIKIINNLNDSDEDLTGSSIILTEKNSYKTYIAYLEKIQNTSEYKAKLQSTQDITKLFDKNGLIIPFASDSMNTSQGFTIKAADQKDANNVITKRLLSINNTQLEDKSDTPDTSNVNYEVTFNDIHVAANYIFTAKLDVGNNDSDVDHTATIYKGLQIQNGQNNGNLLTADTNGFYVGKKEADEGNSGTTTKPSNKIVVTSELNAVETEINNNISNDLKKYYNKEDNDDKNKLIELINDNASAIKQYSNTNTTTNIINGTVIKQSDYNNLTNKISNHLYFVYDDTK